MSIFSEEFNKKYNKLPNNAIINCAMDNNQKPVDTAKYSAHKDKHMAECMNIMQTVRPAGNELLSKVEKIGIDPNFVKPSTGEEAVGKIFESILLSQVLRNMELVPSIELKTPQVSNILMTQNKLV